MPDVEQRRATSASGSTRSAVEAVDPTAYVSLFVDSESGKAVGDTELLSDSSARAAVDATELVSSTSGVPVTA